MNAQVVQECAERVVPNWSQSILAGLEVRSRPPVPETPEVIRPPSGEEFMGSTATASKTRATHVDAVWQSRG